MIGVVVENGELTVTDELEVRPPGPGEVAVRVQASGLCRSDLAYLETPDPRPVVIGHEAAGVVDELGEGVVEPAVGQPVVVVCPRPCLRCAVCARGLYSACPDAFGVANTPFDWRGRAVRSMGRVSSMAGRITVDVRQVHAVHGIEPGAAALIGCAVSTGYGTVRRVVGLRTGESVMVVGVGGIGVNCLQTARLVGARRVVAVDVNPAKADVAAEFGADEFVVLDGVDDDARSIEAALLAAIGEPVDAVVDTTGRRELLGAALGLLRPGGRLGLVGQPHGGARFAEYDIERVMFKHLRIAGALNGGCDPFVDVPDIVHLAGRSRLELAAQVSHRWPVTEVRTAIEALRGGNVRRIVLDHPA